MTDHDRLDPQRFTEQAKELQMDALLHEDAGVMPAPTLAGQIADALRTQTNKTMPARVGWYYAAALLLGLGTVSAVAWLANDERAVHTTAQDPPPKPQPRPTPEQKSPAPTPAPAPDSSPAVPAKFTTWIADYSDNQLVEVAENGAIVTRVNDVFGAWDVEEASEDQLLITEFSVSRVQLIDRKGQTKWAYEDLKNPYDADQLQNGTILIADTFMGRVIEVAPAGNLGGKVVWSYDKDIRPFDADRLANGNTLIADARNDRVLEVAPTGEIVWQQKGLPNIHDADRLQNGNTLITLRNKGEIQELDKVGEVVWRLKGVKSPSDADRLPNGNTLVAEVHQVREFDKDGKVVWQKQMTWPVEVNRSYKR